MKQRFTIEQWRELIAEQEQSGLSIATKNFYKVAVQLA